MRTIISDDLAQNSLLNEFSLKEIVISPVKAGMDMLIFSGWRIPVINGVEDLAGNTIADDSEMDFSGGC